MIDEEYDLQKQRERAITAINEADQFILVTPSSMCITDNTAVVSGLNRLGSIAVDMTLAESLQEAQTRQQELDKENQ